MFFSLVCADPSDTFVGDPRGVGVVVVQSFIS